MVNEKKLKELEIPYIGIKIEAIPTILEVLSKSENDNYFISYYTHIGKKEKTAKEYLSSLRNLGLASFDKNKQNKITKEAINILNDSPELFYKNLSNYIIKRFPSLKMVRDYLAHNSISTLSDLVQVLAKNGYFVKREQTLSSYYKLLNTLVNKEKVKKPSLFNENEVIELNQFAMYIKFLANKFNTKTFDFKKIKELLMEDYKTEINDNIKKHLIDLNRLNIIRLYHFNSALSDNVKDYVIINEKYYYKMEVL